MPTRKSERTSATAILVAVLTGAVAAGAGTVAAEPRLSLGRALAAVAGTTPPAPPAGAGTAITPGATTAPAATASGTPAQSPTTTAGVTTTEPTVAPSTTEPPSTTPPTTPPTTRPATPAPSAQSASSTAPAGTASSQTDRVVELVNAERRRAGCRALTVDQRLLQAAQAHSTDMAVNGYFSHISPDGRTYADRIRAAGYPAPAAENIAYGQRSADEVMRAWMNSRGHRANILNCDHVAIGVGLDTRGWYWTQNFGR